jgi:hypothetical protein
MAATASAKIAVTEPPLQVTLLELVEAVSDVTESDVEAVAMVTQMLETGRVRLRGSFRGLPVSAFC